MPLRPELSEDGDPAQRHGQSPSWKSRPGAQNNGRPQGAREGRVTDVHPTFLGEKFWAVSFFLFFQFRARGWEQSSSEEQERALEAGPAWQTGTPCEASALGPLSQACPWLCPRELAEAPDACAAEGACRGPALFSLLRAPRWGVCQAWPRTGTGTCHFVKIRTMGVGRESVHSCETKVCNRAGRFQATKSPCVKRSRPKSGRKFNSACSQRNESHVSRFQKQFRGSERGLV